MPRDTNGNTSPLPGTIVNTGDTVLPSQHNPMVNDVYAMMTQSLSRDGQGGMRASLDMGTNRVVNVGTASNGSDAVTLAQVQAMIGAIASIPTGLEAWWPNSISIPSGWLRENGQAVSRTTYAELWAFAQASGNLAATEGAKTPGQFGPGDGATTFTLPNFEADGGYFARSITSGRAIGAVQQDEFKSHGHNYSGADIIASVSITSGFTALSRGVVAPNNTNVVGNRSAANDGLGAIWPTGGSETRPKNIARVCIIKV